MAVSSSSSLLLLFLVFGFAAAAARDVYLDGGKPDSWKIPSESDSLNKWAQTVRFRIGDHLSNYHFFSFSFHFLSLKIQSFVFIK
jgi:hypothetical protein